MKVKSLSRAHQAPLGFSKQEYWSGLPFPSPGDLPDPGIEPKSPTMQADTLTSAPPGKPLLSLKSGQLYFQCPDFFLNNICKHLKANRKRSKWPLSCFQSYAFVFLKIQADKSSIVDCNSFFLLNSCKLSLKN